MRCFFFCVETGRVTGNRRVCAGCQETQDVCRRCMRDAVHHSNNLWHLTLTFSPPWINVYASYPSVDILWTDWTRTSLQCLLLFASQIVKMLIDDLSSGGIHFMHFGKKMIARSFNARLINAAHMLRRMKMTCLILSSRIDEYFKFWIFNLVHN